MIYLETIDLFSKIEGISRPPGGTEHLKVPQYDDMLKMFKYLDVATVVIGRNTKLTDGVVPNGNTGAPNYVWKLDADKNPAWRPEATDIHITSISKAINNNSAIFNMSNGSNIPLALGALAWKDTFDFTAGTDFQILFNKNGKIDGTDKLKYDYIANQLKLVDFNGIVVKKSSVDTNFVKILNYLGSGVVELGDNVYIREAIKISDYKGTQPLAGMIQYKNGKPQWHDGLIWNDFANSINTYLETVQQFTVADNVSDAYKLSFVLNDDTAFSIQLGANAFNSKFIPTVSGDNGYLQFANADGDLESSVNLTFLNDVLGINGLIQLTAKVKELYDTNPDGTIIHATDTHFYGMSDGVLKQLDNITYTFENLGLGGKIIKGFDVVNGNTINVKARSIIQGNNIVISETENGIQIDATAGVDSGEVNVGENIGVGVPIYRGKDGVILKYHKITGRNGINVVLDNNTIIIEGKNADGSSSALDNNYLKDIATFYEIDFVEGEYQEGNPYIISNQGRYPTKYVKFDREGLVPIVTAFGANAFDSEPIRNLKEIVNTSNKLRFIFNNTDETDEAILEYQFGKNAFTSNAIPLLNNDTKVWTVGTKELKYNLNYKPDSTIADTANLVTFALKFGSGLSYDDLSNTLDVSALASKYITAITRFEDTTHIVFTFNDASTINLDAFGELAFLDYIPAANETDFGLVKLGGNVELKEDGNLYVALDRLVSYDLQSNYTDEDKLQARTNIVAAFINGHIDEDFEVGNLYVDNLLSAPDYGYGTLENLDAGFHKLSAFRLSGGLVTVDTAELQLVKDYTKVGLKSNALDFEVGADGNISWYSYMSNVKTRIMALLPRNDIDAGLVYDLHVKGEIVQFSDSL